MPAVLLSPVFQWQNFGIDGLPLNAGQLFTYQAGTSTPQATYTTNAGNVANSNPIVLGADGRPPFEIWLVQGQAYKFVLQTALGIQINPVFDNITGSDLDGAAAAVNTAIRSDLAASSGSSLVGWIQAGTGAVPRTVQTKLREIISSEDFGGTRGTDNLGFGNNAIDSMAPGGAGTGVQNIGIGTDALTACTQGFGNTATGYSALSSITVSAYCAAYGINSLKSCNLTGGAAPNQLCSGFGAYTGTDNTIGQYLTCGGAFSGQHNVDGNFNTYWGQNSGVENISGNSNTGVGHSCLQLNKGSRNTAMGDNALPLATSVSDMLSIGYQSLAAMLTGSGLTSSWAVGLNCLASSTVGPNMAGGYLTMQSLQTGTRNALLGPISAGTTMNGAASRNVGLGAGVLDSLTSNSDNTAVGDNALNKTINGGSVAFGSGALAVQTNGGSHAAFGTGAGANITTGANNMCIGLQAGTDAVRNITTASNEIAFGNNNHTAAYIKVAWTVTSDARDKTDQAPIDRGLPFVMSLKPVSFKLQNRETQQVTTGKRYGFLAQDIKALEGEDLVLVDASDEENLKLRESMMVPILWKALQELKQEFDAYKAAHA